MNSVISGALLTVAMRWTDRLIGFLSTLVLARLLAPEDFGVIAMASLVIGLTDVLFDLGVNVSLIQNKSPTQEHYDTAWTLRLLQSIIAAAIVAGAAPWAADYFKEPRITLVIQVLSLSFLLSALENIGVITFQKEMKFGLDFRFTFAKRIAGFCVTMIAAWLMQSYWALVIGGLAGRAVGAVLSYAVHPMRPRLSVAKFREIFGVSQWLLLRNASGYADYKLHQFVVGGREAAATMGAYTIADEIAAMPTSELLAPLNRVLFPALVRVKDDLVELKRVFLLSQGVQTLIGIPAGVGLALVANEVVLIMLGAKWQAAVPFVEIFALLNVMIAIASSGVYLLLTMGHVRTMVFYSWFQVVLFVLVAFFILPDGGALQIAWTRLAIGFLGFFVYLALLINALKGLRLVEMVRVIYRPLVAALVMSGCVIGIAQVSGLSGAALLVVKIATGALSYGVCVIALWAITGQPEGAEAYILKHLKAALASRMRRGP